MHMVEWTISKQCCFACTQALFTQTAMLNKQFAHVHSKWWEGLIANTCLVPSSGVTDEKSVAN